MAVLIEAISVVIRFDSLVRNFPGGLEAFKRIVPNGTLCTDDELLRVGFMSPDDVGAFMERLENNGLVFARAGHGIDMTVVDQQCGPTLPAEWLQFARLTLGGGDDKVAACWLFEGPRVAAGFHMTSKQIALATPAGWRYEGSLSANFKFVANEEMNDKLTFLRREDGRDVYLDRATGKEIFAGRTES
jgi:hypothetical protein